MSIAIWLLALAIYIWVPLIARDLKTYVCAGNTNLNENRAGLVVLAAVPTLFALWRCVLHLADEPTRRPLVAMLTTALVAAAAVSVAVGFAVLGDAGVATDPGC